MDIPKIVLKPGKDKSIVRRHPWVFSGAIKEQIGEISEGSFVEVVANKGRHLGYGHYQNGSIMVRVLLFGNEQLLKIYMSKELHLLGPCELHSDWLILKKPIFLD